MEMLHLHTEMSQPTCQLQLGGCSRTVNVQKEMISLLPFPHSDQVQLQTFSINLRQSRFDNLCES